MKISTTVDKRYREICAAPSPPPYNHYNIIINNIIGVINLTKNSFPARFLRFRKHAADIIIVQQETTKGGMLNIQINQNKQACGMVMMRPAPLKKFAAATNRHVSPKPKRRCKRISSKNFVVQSNCLKAPNLSQRSSYGFCE